MKQEIIQCEEKFLQAFRSSDLKTLEEIMHDKLIYNNAYGKLLNKEMDFEDFRSANPVIETVESLEQEIELFDDTAIVSTVVYLKGLFMNHEVEDKIRFLRVWKKFGESWKVIGAASVGIK